MLWKVASPFRKGIHPESFILKEMERDLGTENPLSPFYKGGILALFQHFLLLKS